MIPSKIHYFWFGRGDKTSIEKECISRFKKFAPGFEVIEWNEENFDVNLHPYTKQNYQDGKWAFVSDYARLKVLYKEGGIYLDTDMYLLKDLSSLLQDDFFIGMEDEKHLSAGIIGAAPRHPFIESALREYDSISERVTIPRVLTKVNSKSRFDIKIYERKYFYPFSSSDIKKFNKSNPPSESFAVHMWNYSWGNPVVRLTKQIGIHKTIVSLLDKLKIKNKLKKLLRLE